MTRRRRALLAALLSASLAGILAAAQWVRRDRGGGATEELRAAESTAAPTQLPPRPAPAARPVEPEENSAEPEENIEDLLAGAGEDLQAVKYMNRIRESLRGGNRAFAQELWRQMKEAHPNSGLLEAAKDLCERSN